MNKQLEEAIKTYNELKRNKEIIENIETNYFLKFAETVLKELKRLQEETIEKDKIREKIEENNKLIEACREDEEHCGEIYLYENDNEILEELLEGK